MLRFKDPERLPGGLRFEICDPDYFSSYGIARVVRGIKSIWPWSNRSIKQDILKNVPSINVDGLGSQSSDSTVDEQDNVIRLRKSRMTTVVNKKNISSSAYSTAHIAQTTP
ncbi:28685_t:CDS:2, partial [Dentiscutata erythropus]